MISPSIVNPIQASIGGLGRFGGQSYSADLSLLLTTTGGLLRNRVGPDFTYGYAAGQVPDGLGGVQSSVIPPVHDDGYYAGPAYSNLFTGGPTGAETKTLSAQKYCLQCIGGSVAAGAYGTATPSVPLIFTASAGDQAFTPTDCTAWQLTASGGYVFPIIPPGQSAVSTVGTTTGNGLSVPLSRDAVRMIPDGVELARDGSFDTSNTWTLQAELAITSGVLSANSPSAPRAAYHTVLGTSLGDSFLVSGDLAITAGHVTFNHRSTYSPNVYSAGAFNVVIPATSGTDNLFYIEFSAGCIGSIDNISLQKLIPDPQQVIASEKLVECFRGVPDGVELVSNGSFSGIANGTDIITLPGFSAYGSPTVREINGERIKLVATDASQGVYFRVDGVPAGTRFLFTCDATGDLGTYGIYTDGLGDISTLNGRVEKELTSIGNGLYIFFRCASNGAGTTYYDNISVQKLNPAVGTVAVLMKMGVGSVEFPLATAISVVESGDEVGDMWFENVNGTYYAIRNYDGTDGLLGPSVAWDRGEYNIKILEFGDGKRRVGNQRYTEAGVAIDANIVWSHATLAGAVNFDGSFNPSDFLRFFLNSTVPNHLKLAWVSNQSGLGDTEILRRLKYAGL